MSRSPSPLTIAKRARLLLEQAAAAGHAVKGVKTDAGGGVELVFGRPDADAGPNPWDAAEEALRRGSP